jgi:predicted CxxxxCH...CXXCH cytochrome family protein
MLAGSGQRFRKPVACSECHPVPLSGAQANEHINGVADVVFGPLASAGAGGPCPDPNNPKCPTWNPATATCSSVYCHGGTLGNGGSAGGTNNAPIWTKVDGTQVGCGTCHAIPPTDPGHPSVVGIPTGNPADPVAVCATCHPGTVKLDTTSGTYGIDIEGGLHIDGVVQIGAYACARCHGDLGNPNLALSPAPPTDMAGNSATTARGVGAHAVHLTGTRLSDTPVACSECHRVPTSMLAHPNPAYGPTNVAVDMSWGPLATAGGSVPSWSTTALTCSTTYCHGSILVGGTATSPKWTQVDGTQVTCTSCHGNPPATPAHALDAVKNPNPANCAACHGPGYSSGNGTDSLDKTLHLDGYIENIDSTGVIRTCTSCHGSSTRKDPYTGQTAPVALQPAPGGANADLSSRSVGVHDAHLFGTTFRTAPIACSECHQSYLSTDHPTLPGHDPLSYDMVRWGPLAAASGSHPAWNAPFPRNAPLTPTLDLTCSTTYCHGATLTGGNNTRPHWTTTAGFRTTSSLGCQSCHGDPPPTPEHTTSTGALRTDCATCHTGYTSSSVNPDVHLNGAIEATGGSCTSCHGDPSRTPSTVAAAPPVSAGTGSSPWAASDPGAHQKHLTGTVLRSAPIDCAECHTVPTGPPGPAGSGDTHGDGAATVVFGSLSRTDGASPRFNADLSCSTTYCHGSTLVGGTETAPKWTETGGAASACGACHGVPPADTTHTPLAAGTTCSSCHAGYGGQVGGAPGAFAINPSLHLNGTVDATGGSCTSCHGTSSRTLLTGADPQTAAAPPLVANSGGPWSFGAGTAHVNHLDNASPLARRVACAECHAVPSSAPRGGSDTHGDGAATLVAGTLARTVLTLSNGGAGTPITPVMNPGNGTTAPSCSTVYCHGAFTLNANSRGVNNGQGATISWDTAGPLACSSCHGVNGSGVPVPNDSCHPPNFNHDGGNRCSDCHKGVNSTGTAINAANYSLHVNGVIDGKCTDCHAGASLGSSKNRICQ